MTQTSFSNMFDKFCSLQTGRAVYSNCCLNCWPVILMTALIVILTSPLGQAGHANAFAARAQESSLPQVVSSGQDVVVKLFGAGVGNLDSYGSGVLVSSEGHVLTVWNHLINVGYLTAVTSSGKRYSVRVMGTSKDHDVALLKLQNDNGDVFPFISLADIQEAEPGTSVLAFSNMFHVATGNEPVSVVHGTVAAKTPLSAGQGRWKFPLKSEVLIVDSVTNNSGAAGGLLTNLQGRPVGLIGREIRHLDSQTWVNYAVPLTTLKPVVETLLEGKRVESQTAGEDKRPRITDRQLTVRFGITMLPDVVERTPAYIDAVSRRSPAEAAGLRRGDLIVLIDDDIVTSVTDFQQHLAARRPGQKISVTVSRGQQLISIDLKVP